VFRILHTAYQVFPDSPAAARGTARTTEPQMTREQVLLARLMKGIHW
jgi:hypothetical protein